MRAAAQCTCLCTACLNADLPDYIVEQHETADAVLLYVVSLLRRMNVMRRVALVEEEDEEDSWHGYQLAAQNQQ